MNLKLQMIGTGSAFARKYFNNNALLQDGDFTLLIDCGVTAPLALHQLDKSFADVDAVLITHIHADHVGGLEELAFKMKFTFHRKIKLYIAESLTAILWEHSLKGGLYQAGEITSLEDLFEVCPLTPHQPYSISEHIQVELIPTEHIPGKNSYSLYFNDRFFYSSDMIFNPDLLQYLVKERSCGKIFHDCQLEGRGEVHTTLEELMTLPEDIRKITYLMHYGDNKNEFLGKIGEMDFIEQGHIYLL
ncbi:MBL fold metallo-hydrolase [Paenibacillus sp. KQZ6P-2]|uniref:MBL fold metallo-hydrolase n=1 Tax=Paenibacillus mangrovi TaxID=2931978 RepID=A0A9X1WNZ3_9BACL|nr:MBL fold metallo-hydrolase [Paenibacillus mangrovi]MCJ8011320.1 MBL fold metallo-hydrolase [Paenibacillus mangrovi]